VVSRGRAWWDAPAPVTLSAAALFAALLAALVAALFAFLLARTALLPGLGFWDTGEFQVVGPVLGTAHPTGFPAYVILGWLASAAFTAFGDPAFRMNLLSAVLVAGAAALVVVLAWQLTSRAWIGLAVGCAFAATPIAWNIGTHADPHALHVLLMTLLLALLVGWESRARDPDRARRYVPPGRGVGGPGDRWLMAAAITFGVGLANHFLTLLFVPGIALYVLAVEPGIRRRVGFVAELLGMLLGTTAVLYLELPLRAGPFPASLVYGHPDTVGGFLYVVLALQFLGTLSQPFAHLGGKVTDFVQLGLDQLGFVALLLPLGFLAAVWRRPRYALLTGVTFVVVAWFAASYNNADIERYYLLPLVIALSWVAVLAATTLELVWRALGTEPLDEPAGVMAPLRRADWFGTPRAIALALELTIAVAVLVPTIDTLPNRAAAENLSQDQSATEWAHTVLQTVKPNAVIVSWWSYSTTLWYAQIIEGLRPDVWVVDDRTRLDDHLGGVGSVIEFELGKRPIYLIRLEQLNEIPTLEDSYDLRPFQTTTDQLMYEVIGRRTP
jgi:hypothetical protein